MKRDHKPKYDGLFPVFTLFEWHQCCKCGQDFRRERGWRFWTGPFYSGCGVLKYLCRECAPTEDDAHRVQETGVGKPGSIPPLRRPRQDAEWDTPAPRGDE